MAALMLVQTVFLFFFQAEDGIRDVAVTGVQTCALPICNPERANSLQEQNRMRLLQRVRSFWITGVLEQSLHGAALLTLGLQEQPDAVTKIGRASCRERVRE